MQLLSLWVHWGIWGIFVSPMTGPALQALFLCIRVHYTLDRGENLKNGHQLFLNAEPRLTFFPSLQQNYVTPSSSVIFIKICVLINAVQRGPSEQGVNCAFREISSNANSLCVTSVPFLGIVF